VKKELEKFNEKIRSAYNLEKDKFEALNITVEDLELWYKKLTEANQKIELAIKNGELPEDTPEYSFPIHIETGKIPLERLKRELKKAENMTIEKLKESFRKEYYDFIAEVCNEETVKYAKIALKDVPIMKIREEIMEEFQYLYFVCIEEEKEVSFDFNSWFIDKIKELGYITKDVM
jgi:hypothetical protein